jgi:F-type H+-transporting ATPase subunit gamma
MTRLVADLARSGLEVSHPLLEGRDETNNALVLSLSANRGLCGGYNSNAIRLTASHYQKLSAAIDNVKLEVSGKRGINGLKFRGVPIDQRFTHFDDKPQFAEVEKLANRYLEAYTTGQLDRLDVIYTRFVSASRQIAVVETLLPLGSLEAGDEAEAKKPGGETLYEFLPSAETILEEVVPTSFKIRLFKCFLDASVSEQIARMVAMKSATEAAGDMIKAISREYNRARQSRITSEIMEVIGGAQSLEG